MSQGEEIQGALARRLLLRSLLVQGMWNPRDFQGSGIRWALMEEGGTEGEGVSDTFNAHPYLTGLALGALARASTTDGLPDTEVARFRTALRAPLGSLGDALVWAGWLPASLLVAILLVAIGAPPLAVVFGFLGVYNLFHLALRRWGVRTGLTHGLDVGVAIARSFLRPLGDRLRRTVIVLAGALAGISAVLAVPVLVGEPIGTAAVARISVSALILLGIGYLCGARLPVTTPLRVAATLLLAGWIASWFQGA